MLSFFTRFVGLILLTVPSQSFAESRGEPEIRMGAGMDAESSRLESPATNDEVPGIRSEHRMQGNPYQEQDRLLSKAARQHSLMQVSIRSGYFLGSVEHPEYLGRRAEGLMLELDLGVEINTRWSAGVQISVMSMPVTRIETAQYKKRKSNRLLKRKSNSFRVGCSDCPPPLSGGETIASEMASYIAGPRVEFSPMGRDGEGIYFSGSAGLGTIELARREIGGGFAVRSGYRYYLGSRVGLSVSAGMQGILAERSRAWLPFAGAELRFR